MRKQDLLHNLIGFRLLPHESFVALVVQELLRVVPLFPYEPLVVEIVGAGTALGAGVLVLLKVIFFGKVALLQL